MNSSMARSAVRTGAFTATSTLTAIRHPWLIHGLYDFGLNPDIVDLHESVAFISVFLAFLDIVLVVIMVVFVLKARKKPKYTGIIIEAGKWIE